MTPRKRLPPWVLPLHRSHSRSFAANLLLPLANCELLFANCSFNPRPSTFICGKLFLLFSVPRLRGRFFAFQFSILALLAFLAIRFMV
jgi:hypothetical protein